MLSVEEARSQILDALSPCPIETVSISHASGRVLASPLHARRTQPPFDISAMDGYAVRHQDLSSIPCDLTIIGEAPAGRSFTGTVGPSETVRIFTGGPVPDGADTIVIQENTTRKDDIVTITEGTDKARFIRPAGLDFSKGDVGPATGTRLSPNDIALVGAMDLPWIDVHRKPRVGVLATGDELVRPGDPVGPDQIIASNSLGLCAQIEQSGGIAVDLGIAPDTREGLIEHFSRAHNLDLIITIGGASVGDYDLIHDMLGGKNADSGDSAVGFYKIAMRPGKPLIFGRMGPTPLIGLPGNPVSAMVCGLIFVVPAVAKLSGLRDTKTPLTRAILGMKLGENDQRQEYVRARLNEEADGTLTVLPFDKQDSAMLTLLSRADCLIIRPPHAPPAKPGDQVTVIKLRP